MSAIDVGHPTVKRDLVFNILTTRTERDEQTL